MNTWPKSRAPRNSSGQALVEFAMVSLMLVALLLSVVEIGHMLLVYTTVANAARAGARYASVHGHDRAGGTGADGESGPGNNPAQVLSVVENYAGPGLVTLTASNITVAYSPSNTPGSTVTVTVSYPYVPWITYFAPMLNARLASISQAVITF